MNWRSQPGDAVHEFVDRADFDGIIRVDVGPSPSQRKMFAVECADGFVRRLRCVLQKDLRGWTSPLSDGAMHVSLVHDKRALALDPRNRAGMEHRVGQTLKFVILSRNHID